MFKSKRAQAAMEFLMTYGWALLVVLIVLAGLAYFGILNISQFLPDKIDMATGLVAQKFFLSAEDNSLTIYLANGVGAPITNLQMTFPCQNGSLSSTIASLPSGKTDTIKIYCPMTEGSRFRGNNEEPHRKRWGITAKTSLSYNFFL